MAQNNDVKWLKHLDLLVEYLKNPDTPQFTFGTMYKGDRIGQWYRNQQIKFNNKKIVIPYMNCFNSYNGELNIDYTARRFFADIERIFAYFDAEPIFSDINYICNEYNHFGQSKKCEFKYFFVDFYKKGTVHITFKDDELLKKFNIYGCLK